MADYDEMYKVLFRAITKVIDILQAAQMETEEMYIQSESEDETQNKLTPRPNGRGVN